MFKKAALLALGLSLAIGGICLLFGPNQSPSKILSPLTRFNKPTSVPKPLEKYYFENLRKQKFPGSEIKLEKIIKEEEKYTSWLFSFQSNNKKVTGMANIPMGSGKLPVIIMLRGYVDDEIYFTGLGTRKAAGVFAENGFITLAPDFLGFGNSDSPSEDILEARFARPITVLNLLASVKTLPQANLEKIFFWAHSNGGQIALSVLEITQKDIPTTLWAPITKGFPESILHYMDDYENLDELGKEVYDKITNFCKNYNSQKVSINNYFADINAPIQVHQGSQDPLIDQKWSDEFVEKIKNLGEDITYFKYSKSNHHLKQDWDEVVEKDLEFFKNF